MLLQFGVAKLLDYQEQWEGSSHFWSANVSFAKRLVRSWIDRDRDAPTPEKRCFYKNGMLPQWEALERSSNPFSAIVMAHLKTQGTRQQPRERLQWKLSIVKALYQRGYSRRNIRELFRLIDWIMTLTSNLETGFRTEIQRFKEEGIMPNVITIETMAMMASRREDIADILQTRFAAVPDEVVSAIGQIYNLERLKLLLNRAVTINSLAEYQEIVDRALAEERSETEEFE